MWTGRGSAVQRAGAEPCYVSHSATKASSLARYSSERVTTSFSITAGGKSSKYQRQLIVASSECRRYRRKRTAVLKPRDEWIGVPVPDAGIPREVVDAARARIKDNKPCLRRAGAFGSFPAASWCVAIAGRV